MSTSYIGRKPVAVRDDKSVLRERKQLVMAADYQL